MIHLNYLAIRAVLTGRGKSSMRARRAWVYAGKGGIDRARRVLLACAMIVAAMPGHAWAQTWPGKPVRMLVPASVGSAPDVVARILAERLAAIWAQGVAVDNRPGAGGIPGMSMLARSPNDGYTIGFVPSSMVCITPLVYKDPQIGRAHV